MAENLIREVVYYKRYYLDFYDTLDIKVQLKFDWTIDLIETQELLSEKYFKHITNSNGIYEIRVKVSKNIYRAFCFFDDGKLIVAINGFQKKSQKTPKKELKRAQKIRKEYYDEK